MSIQSPASQNPLELAVSQLRSICDDRERLRAFDAGSVERMAVHITNINHSVLASMQDHVNAAKRLNDFAATLDRIARNADEDDGGLASQMTVVASNLRAASAQLASADAIPDWRRLG